MKAGPTQTFSIDVCRDRSSLIEITENRIKIIFVIYNSFLKVVHKIIIKG